MQPLTIFRVFVFSSILFFFFSGIVFVMVALGPLFDMILFDSRCVFRYIWPCNGDSIFSIILRSSANQTKKPFHFFLFLCHFALSLSLALVDAVRYSSFHLSFGSSVESNKQIQRWREKKLCAVALTIKYQLVFTFLFQMFLFHFRWSVYNHFVHRSQELMLRHRLKSIKYRTDACSLLTVQSTHIHLQIIWWTYFLNRTVIINEHDVVFMVETKRTSEGMRENIDKCESQLLIYI